MKMSTSIMSATRPYDKWLNTATILISILSVLLSISLLAAGKETQPNGLIRVVAKMESGTLIYNERVVTQSKVFEINEFPGVILDARGYIATYLGNHWIKYIDENSKASWIIVNPEFKLQGELVGIDERISIAVLKVKGYEGHPSILGNSQIEGRVRLAAWQDEKITSTSMKVLETIERKSSPEKEIRAVELNSGHQLADYYESGSYLLDVPGRFLGFVTRTKQVSLARKVRSYQVIPSIVVRQSLKTVLQSGGNVPPGWLGITFDPTKSQLSIVDVRENSPAEEVGLKSGDMILAVDGEPIYTLVDFSKIIRWRGPGTLVDLKIARESEIFNLAPKLAEWPVKNQATLAWRVEVPKIWKANPKSSPEEWMKIEKVPLPPAVRLGFVLYPLSPKLAKALKVPSEIGLLVEDVKEDSLASEYGFKVGDILLEANGQKLIFQSDFRKILESPQKNPLVFHFLRDGRMKSQKLIIP